MYIEISFIFRTIACLKIDQLDGTIITAISRQQGSSWTDNTTLLRKISILYSWLFTTTKLFGQNMYTKNVANKLDGSYSETIDIICEIYSFETSHLNVFLNKTCCSKNMTNIIDMWKITRTQTVMHTNFQGIACKLQHLIHQFSSECWFLTFKVIEFTFYKK